jgi:hypothetical protein
MGSLTFKKTFVVLEVKGTLLILSLSIVLPFFVHLVFGATIAQRLLPMFYAPLIAAFFFRPHVAIICGLLSPTLNWLITGLPTADKILVLTLKLVVFAIVACILSRKFRWWR